MKQALKDWVLSNKGVFTGALIGLILALMMLIIGFFRTLLIAFFVAVGAAIGAMPQVRAAVKMWATDTIEKFFKN